jgi:hypothetical protein
MAPALLLSLLLTAPGEPFVATGEVLFNLGGAGTSAAFDADRVVGPTVNLTRQDGGWSGDIRQRQVALKVSDTRLLAPNFDVHLSHATDRSIVEGNVFGRHYRFEYGPRGLTGKSGGCAVELKPTPEGILSGEMGCLRKGKLPAVGKVVLRLTGQAGDPTPPLPQFALALISVFP